MTASRVDKMPSGAKDVTIGEVASVLQRGFFLLTGSFSGDGYPIIFSLDGISPEPDEETQRNALIYIASLPTISADKNLHYCFVLDRRKSSWSGVRKLYTLISASFSRPVKEVVLLQPTGMFQNVFRNSESVKLKADFPSLRTVILDDTDALVQRYGVDNLCKQFGGSIHTNIDAFIQQRMSIDSLEINCVDLEERVKELLLVRARSDFDIPNDVASTEALLNEHAEIKTNLTDEISNIKSQGEIVLSCFRDQLDTLPLSQQMLHLQEVQKLTTRLDDLDETINDFWKEEEQKLQEFMKLREFHDEFKSLQHNLTKLSESLTNVKACVSSVDEANANNKRLAKIETESQNLLARSKWVAQVWSSKISEGDAITFDSVGPKCEELLRLHGVCTESLRHKQLLSVTQISLYTHLDQARQWLSDEIGEAQNGVSTLSSQLKNIECQIAIAGFLEILKFTEFTSSYSEALTENVQTEVKKVYDEVMELMVRYQLRRSTLIEEIAKLTMPFKPQKQQKGVMRRSTVANIFRKASVSDEPVSPESADSCKHPYLDNNDNVKGGKQKIRHLSSNSSVRQSSRGSLNSESSALSAYNVQDERTTPKQNLEVGPSNTTPAFFPVSPTGSFLSHTDSGYKGDNVKGNEDEQCSEGSELTSEHGDMFTELARQTNDLKVEPEAPKQTPNKARRGSIKAIKHVFTKRKSRNNLFDNKSDHSLNVNSGVFEKSLTMEEERTMAKVRSELMNGLVSSEEKYIQNVNHIIEFYMRPIAEAGDNVPTDLYANQSLIFSNLEEIYEFSSKVFLHELRDSIDSPSLIASTFRNRINSLSKYKDYCTSRSRAEVLLRQLVDDEFLAEKVRLQGHNSTLCAQLLLPAKQIVCYNKFLQGLYNNLRDDLEAQRDIALVISLLSDTVQTADNLLHQVTIDGYHVDLPTHGSLLHQGRVLVAHDKKSHHTKPSDFKTKLKPRHIFLYEKCLLFCRIHEDNDKLRPYSYMHAIKLTDSVLEKCGETSNKFVFRCNNESYFIQCETADQTSWYENIQFALDNCDEKHHQQFSARRQSYTITKTLVNHATSPTLMLDDDDIILGADPDVDMFDIDGDIDIMDSLTKSPNSVRNHNEINGNSLQQYMLKDDFDNDLLLGKGDIVECVTIRKDMMQVQIPGTAIKSWIPTEVLVSYN